jgi:putative membrane protein
VRPGAGETQPERTALSWQRTSLGVIAVAGLLGHRALVSGHPELVLLAGGCALMGVGLLSGVAASRDRKVRAAADRDLPVAAPALAIAGTAVAVLVAVAAAIAVLAVRLT